MGRSKMRVCAKRDTPAKTTVEKRPELRRPRPKMLYDALPEETHVPPTEANSPAKANIQPGHSKAVLDMRSAAFSENPRNMSHPDLFAAVMAKKTPPGLQMISEPELFKSQNLAATPESDISSSMESDTMFTSDDDCYSSAVSSSDTLPSPEIFRRGDDDAETPTFCIKAQHLHPIIKNSTLLDGSCAQNIHMQESPDLSVINNASPLLAEKCAIGNNIGREGDTHLKNNSFKSDDDIKCKTPAKVTRKQLMMHKKVCFKNPIVTVYPIVPTPATKWTPHLTTDPVQTLSPADEMKPGEKASRPGEMNSKDDTLPSSVLLKSPVTGSTGKAKFFDFANKIEEKLFFQMARERSVKLRSAPLFPLIAAKHVSPSHW